MRKRRWTRVSVAVALLIVGAVAAVAVVAVDGGDDAEATVRTERGVRWSVDGAVVSVTVTSSAPVAVRRGLRGRVYLGCRMIGPTGETQEITVTSGPGRFRRGSRTVRIRLSPRLDRVDACSMTGAGVEVAVRFAERAEQRKQTLVIP